MDSTGSVRRTDLYLRAKYPEVTTEIYKLAENVFTIYCKYIDGNFEAFEEEFRHSIKPVFTPVSVTNALPADFMEIVPPILDHGISKDFEGIPLTTHTLLNLLLSKFPHINFYKVTDEPGKVTVYTASYKEKVGDTVYHRFLTNKDRDRVTSFLEGLKHPFPFELLEENFLNKPSDPIPPIHNPVQFIYAANFNKGKSFDFSLRDEAIWYDQIDAIFEGKFKKNNLFFYTPGEYTCYVDYSIFPNIDIRNHLLLFQTVYITPPFDQGIAVWLRQSKMQRKELLDLISKGRIKIILTQPESRYDLNFLEETYQANPSALITRRAVAALLQADVVEISDKYFLNDTACLKEIRSFSTLLSEFTKIDARHLYEFFVWPIKARRTSFEPLNNSGLFATPAFGVNNAIEKRLSQAVKKDLEFEFTTNSPSIHLANALNATYFPFQAEDGYTDLYYASVMGELLNFYKSASIENIKPFLEGKREVSNGILPISPIEVFEINDFITISQLEDVFSEEVVFPGSKRLLETLSELPAAEREQKISYYNQEVSRRISRKEKRKGAIDLGTNGLLDAVGYLSGFPAAGSTFSFINTGGKHVLKSVPLVKNILSKMEEAFHKDTDKSNIHFLTKINRVAKLKRE